MGLSSASGAVVNATISDVGNGTYSAYYTPTASGVYRLDVTLGGRPVGDSPYRLSVFPAPTSPAHCAASGAGLLEAIAGESSSFVIVPRDSFGNARPLERSDRFTVALARRGASGEASPSATATSFSSGGLKWQPAVVTDLQNGTYGAEYVVKRAGAYLIEVKLGGVHVMGSPFQVSVLAGKTSARASTAQGAGLRTSVAGTPSSFEVIARDDFGNLRSVCGDDFEVTLSGPETLKGGSHVHGIVSENGNGTYVVEYAVTSAGLYYIAVTLSGRHISGSPFSMQTMPAAARSSHSLAFGSGLSRAVAGRLNEFSILAKDTYGNAEHASAGGNFSVVLTYSSRQDGVGSSSSPSKQVGAAATLAPIKARIVDSLTGVYTASYVPKRAGTYSVDVSYNQLPIFGSPYTTVVVPGRAHAASSVVGCTEIAAEAAGDAAASSSTTECAALVGFAGEVNSFTIVSRDSEGNDCATGGEKVEALLLLPPRSSDESPLMSKLRSETRGAGVPVAALDLGDGRYSASYRVLPAGNYQLSITIDGEHIAGSPFATKVKPGTTCAANSKVEGDGRLRATAGEKTSLTIRAVDCYGNAATSGGDPFGVSLLKGGMPSVVAEVLDRNDGTYFATYTPSVSGLWMLHVTTGGSGGHASGSPFSVLVLPGPTDAHASIAVGEGTSMAAIGEKTVVLVRTKDKRGNDRATGGDYVHATLTQRSTNSVVHAKVRDTGDGTYQVSYVLTISALPHDYLMAIRVNNASIGGSPFRVRARPGPTVCEQTISISLPRCVAGTVSEAPIFAKDRLGNQRTSGGDVFSASLELLDGSSGSTADPSSAALTDARGVNESVQVRDNGDGTYRALWVVTRASKHRLWIGGTCGPIRGSPYDVECVPADLSVTHSQLTGAGASEGFAGAKTTFGIKARDVFDNELIEGRYMWGASLLSSTSSYAVTQDPASNGGKYELAYNATRAGVYELIVGALGSDGKVNASLQVQGSPATVTVRPGPLCGRRSKVFGPTVANGGADGGAGATNGAAVHDASDGAWLEGAGRPVRLWVEARDAHDNPHETAIDPAPFRIVVTRKGDGKLAAPAAVVRAASRGGSGAYTADFVLPSTGDYLVRAFAEVATGASGEAGELRGSPYPLRIVAGPTSAFQCTASGAGLSSAHAKVGSLQFVTITARDMYGNARSSGGDRFAITLDGPNGTRLVGSSMVDYNNGTFVGSYLATISGHYVAHVQRSDEAGVFWDIKGSPFKLNIGSGELNPFVSRLVGPHEVTAGEQVGFTLMSRDEFGNAPTHGGDNRNRFEVSVVARSGGAPSAPVARIYDAGKGNYTVLHMFTSAGEYAMRTSLLGAGGGPLPDFPLRVLPGPLSPPHSELIWPCHTPNCVDASSRRSGYFVNWPVRFSVAPFDAFGNRRADGGSSAIFIARVHGPRPTAAHAQLRCAGDTGLPDSGTTALHCKAVRHADGLYVVEFIPLVRGEFTINVTVHAGPHGSRKLGNIPGSMAVRVDAAPVATCAKFKNCTSHGHCDYMTGRCVCDAGFDGDDCSHGAAARRACPNDCSGHGYCSDETDGWGRNMCRCAVDYTGADCSTWVSQRGSLAYQQQLKLAGGPGPLCPNECSGHGVCNVTCGECACEPGYSGDDCSASGEHHLSPIATDALGRTLLLDYSPSTRRFAVHAVHKTVHPRTSTGGATDEVSCAGVEARPLCSGTWPVVLDTNRAAWSRPFLFASLGGGMLLQYEPAYGAYLLLGCDGTCDGGVPCSRRLAQGRCSELQLPLGPSMRASYLGQDTVLFHNGATGAYSVHRLAPRGFLEQSSSGCMFDPPLASGHWAEIGVHRYTWMGVGDLMVDYEPARGNYSIVNINRAAQAGEDPKGAIATRGHLMATSKAFVSLGEGMLMLASDGIASAGVRSADGPGGTPPGGIAPGAAATATPPDAFGDGAYAMWSCSHDSAEYSPHSALPCRPVGHADGLGRPHACPSGCAAGDCSCETKGACTSQPGCGWCEDTAAGMCMQGSADGPTIGARGECFAWSYGPSSTSSAAASSSATSAASAALTATPTHSYAYVEKGQLMDYSGADGKYRLWALSKPVRQGCPAVAWPPVASGTLAVTRHALAAIPAGVADGFALLDYDPTNGDYRLGGCNRTLTTKAGHLDCKTSSNGTWHTGGLQLLWVGGQTVMRYSKATGQFSLWGYSPTADAAKGAAGRSAAGLAAGAIFDAAPLAEGSLLRSNGQRLKGATLTYLDAGELLAMVPSTGHIAIYRRANVPAPAASSGGVAGSSWALAPEGEGAFVPPSDGFELRWESGTVLRGWQASYIGAHTLMLLKPATSAYRVLNCSGLYGASAAAISAAARASGVGNGPPCPLLLEGSLPSRGYCEHSKDHCLLAPHCGWCASSDKCVPANEDGVCFGSCPDGQLIYSSGTAPLGSGSASASSSSSGGLGGTVEAAEGGAAATSRATCAAQLSCDRCAESSECAWCAAPHSPYGGSCLQATDAVAGECASGQLVQYDSSKCEDPLVEVASRAGATKPTVFAGLVSQAR